MSNVIADIDETEELFRVDYHETRDIPLDQIDIGKRLRSVDDGHSLDLRESMKAIGQLNSIWVREQADGRYKLIAGMHRYDAARLLEWPTIRADIWRRVDDDELAQAQDLVAEVFENVARLQPHPVSMRLMMAKADQQLRLISARAAVKRAKSAVAKADGAEKRRKAKLRLERAEAAMANIGRPLSHDGHTPSATVRVTGVSARAAEEQKISARRYRHLVHDGRVLQAAAAFADVKPEDLASSLKTVEAIGCIGETLKWKSEKPEVNAKIHKAKRHVIIMASQGGRPHALLRDAKAEINGATVVKVPGALDDVKEALSYLKALVDIGAKVRNRLVDHDALAHAPKLNRILERWEGDKAEFEKLRKIFETQNADIDKTSKLPKGKSKTALQKEIDELRNV